jgi:hypothetical protein
LPRESGDREETRVLSESKRTDAGYSPSGRSKRVASTKPLRRDTTPAEAGEKEIQKLKRERSESIDMPKSEFDARKEGIDSALEVGENTFASNMKKSAFGTGFLQGYKGTVAAGHRAVPFLGAFVGAVIGVAPGLWKGAKYAARQTGESGEA